MPVTRFEMAVLLSRIMEKLETGGNGKLQADKVDLLVGGQRPDEAGDLAHHGIGATILQHIDHIVVGSVRSGIRVGSHFLGVELAGLLDQKADFFSRNRQFWHRELLFLRAPPTRRPAR